MLTINLTGVVSRSTFISENAFGYRVPQIYEFLFEEKSPMRMLNPPHPGDFIRTEIIEPLGLSVTAAAKALAVSRPALSNLLNGRADLSGDMALRVEKAFGVKMDTLMRMQSSFDIALTRKNEKTIRVRRYVPRVSDTPRRLAS